MFITRIVIHNFTQVENHDFKLQFQLKNEMYVKLWVRTYVQQVSPITTGILPPKYVEVKLYEKLKLFKMNV